MQHITAITSESPSPSPEGWDMGSFLDSSQSYFLLAGGGMMALMGIISIIWGCVLLLKKIMSGLSGFGYEYQASWMKIVILIVMGGALTFTGGILLRGVSSEAEDEVNDLDSDPSPTPTPAEESETSTISMPQVEGALPMLGLIALVLIILGMVWLLLHFWLKQRRARRKAAEAAEAAQKRIDEAWQSYIDTEKKVMEKFLHAETDWDMIFNYPSLTDPKVEETSALYKAMRAVDRANSEQPENLSEESDLTSFEYPRAVIAFEAAWDTAFAHAKRVGQKSIPKPERRLLRDIRDLLSVAENPASAETERSNAKRRIKQLIKRLEHVKLPTRTMDAIEAGTMLQIESVESLQVDMEDYDVPVESPAHRAKDRMTAARGITRSIYEKITH